VVDAHAMGRGGVSSRAPPSAVRGETDACLAAAGCHHDGVWAALWPDPARGGQSWASRALSWLFPENRSANHDYGDLGGDLSAGGGIGDVVCFYAWARAGAWAQLWGGFLVRRWTRDVSVRRHRIGVSCEVGHHAPVGGAGMFCGLT